MKYQYTPTGVCSHKITIEEEDGIIKQISFCGGCNGNLKGIASLCQGLPIEEVIKRLKGITCGYKNTSCPDQLAQALENILSQK